MSRWSLRSRLTVSVTVVFAAVAIAGTALALRALDANLQAGARLAAETLLDDYTQSLVGEASAIGVVEDDQQMRFLYLDGGGQEISEFDYLDVLFGSVYDADFPSEAAIAFDEPGQDLIIGPVAAGETVEVIGPIDPATIDLDAVTFDPLADAVLSPSVTLDYGPEVVVVARTLSLADGSEVTVGVSNPMAPVRQGMASVATAAWIIVPLLILVVAAISWISTTRALAPIDRVTRRARAITADDLSARLPIPAGDDEVRALVDTVNDLLGRIEASRHQQRRLIADASHELRSPVAASRVQLEVGLTTLTSAEEWQATAKAVLDEQEQLSDLVDDLLALSRLDESSEGTAEPVDVVGLVVAEAGRARVPVPKVSVRPELDAWVLGDEELLRRVFRNVVDNAARHAAATVEVTVERATSSVLIHVDDDGPGVPESDRERVFQRFTRLDESRSRHGGGTGLGLAIVAGVVAAHEGMVVCTDGPLGGARFTIELPAVDGP
jgi:signal transduction histidine kinase